MTKAENGDIMYTEKDKKPEIEFKHIKIINRILSQGERVELVPTKDGVKVFKIVRREQKE